MFAYFRNQSGIIIIIYKEDVSIPSNKNRAFWVYHNIKLIFHTFLHNLHNY